VSVLLRIAGGVSFAWAVVLLGLKEKLFAPAALSPLGRAFANGLGITQLVFAYVFWYGAAAPAANRGAIYAAIMLMALRTANDLYQLLVLLPPEQALISLADLVVSVALLVGILEALPRVLVRKGTDAEV
jgi:TPR repeat protein